MIDEPISTLGFWKIVMEEAAKGDPNIQTPSTVSVQPIRGLYSVGAETIWSCGPSVSVVRSKSGGASFPPALICHLGTAGAEYSKTHLFLLAAQSSFIKAHGQTQSVFLKTIISPALTSPKCFPPSA